MESRSNGSKEKPRDWTGQDRTNPSPWTSKWEEWVDNWGRGTLKDKHEKEGNRSGPDAERRESAKANLLQEDLNPLFNAIAVAEIRLVYRLTGREEDEKVTGMEEIEVDDTELGLIGLLGVGADQ